MSVSASDRLPVFGRRKEPHTVIIAHGDAIRHFTVRPWLVAVGGSALLAIAVGYLLATSYLVLRDDLIGASTARQARIQQAYEDRISALQGAGRPHHQPSASRSAIDGGQGHRAARSPVQAVGTAWPPRTPCWTAPPPNFPTKRLHLPKNRISARPSAPSRRSRSRTLQQHRSRCGKRAMTRPPIEFGRRSLRQTVRCHQPVAAQY